MVHHVRMHNESKCNVRPVGTYLVGSKGNMWHVDLFPLGPLHSGNSLSGSVKIPELPQRFRQLLWAAIAPTKLSRSPGLAPGSHCSCPALGY